MTDKQYVKNTLREMLDYYADNIGNESKYSGEIITPKMIAGVTRRFLELTGEFVNETNDSNIEV